MSAPTPRNGGPFPVETFPGAHGEWKAVYPKAPMSCAVCGSYPEANRFQWGEEGSEERLVAAQRAWHEKHELHQHMAAASTLPGVDFSKAHAKAAQAAASVRELRGIIKAVGLVPRIVRTVVSATTRAAGLYVQALTELEASQKEEG